MSNFQFESLYDVFVGEIGVGVVRGKNKPPTGVSDVEIE